MKFAKSISGACAIMGFMTFGLPAVVVAEPKGIAVLQGLDKVTARVSTFQVRIDQPIDFGALRIRVRHCDRTPPEERPEAAAFVEIDELRPGQDQKVLFTGWMFASSPGLNAVEHAVYDVWLLDCIDPEEPAAPQAE